MELLKIEAPALFDERTFAPGWAASNVQHFLRMIEKDTNAMIEMQMRERGITRKRAQRLFQRMRTELFANMTRNSAAYVAEFLAEGRNLYCSN